MKTLIQILLFLCLISCNHTLSVTESDKKLLGTYKNGSDNYYEILILEDNYLLYSEFSSRVLAQEIFKENGRWKVKNDTLLIERIRHDVLKEFKFPAKQSFVIKENRLFELRENYKGELLETQIFFEKH
jgi:hypothetical protein